MRNGYPDTRHDALMAATLLLDQQAVGQTTPPWGVSHTRISAIRFARRLSGSARDALRAMQQL